MIWNIYSGQLYVYMTPVLHTRSTSYGGEEGDRHTVATKEERLLYQRLRLLCAEFGQVNY